MLPGREDRKTVAAADLWGAAEEEEEGEALRIATRDTFGHPGVVEATLGLPPSLLSRH